MIKKIQILFVLFCLTAGMGVIHAQEVYTPSGGFILLTTQADVDTLGMDLGANTIIDGNLVIQEVDDSTDLITDLSVLRNVTEIRGFFEARSIIQLTELSHETSTSGVYAFNALEKITKNFLVGTYGLTISLTNIGNFPNLRSIGIGLFISRNASLTTIDADNFPALATIGGSLSISTNHMLSTLSGFPTLRTIGNGLFIANHDLLTTTGDYPALTSIGGHFNIGGSSISDTNDVLTTIGDFSALTTIKGNITIRYNPMLSNCSGLPASVINPRATISDNGAGCFTDATLGRTNTGGCLVLR